MNDTIEARVARGAALLDEKLPGWVDRINLDKLDLTCGCHCILGQTWDGNGDVGEEYWLHAERLFDDDSDLFVAPADHGFNAHDGEGEEYAALAIEWRRLILARRAGAEVSR